VRLFTLKEMKSEKENLDPRITKMAEKLRQMRIAKGYSSYEKFAWENGINRVQYYRVEKGENITLKTLLRILDIHKVSLSVFCDDID